MAAPDIEYVDPYTGRGTMEYVWIEDLADYKNPTRTELDAGVCLTPNVYDHDGFTVKSSQVDAPNARDRFTPTIAGEQKADDSSISSYIAKDGVDARDLMPEDAEGYIARYPGGDKEGYLVDIFPVQVSAQNKVINLDGGKPDGMQFQFAIKRKPELNHPIPTTV